MRASLPAPEDDQGKRRYHDSRTHSSGLSAHFQVFSPHLRPNCLVDVFYCHDPSTATGRSSPWVILRLTMV